MMAVRELMTRRACQRLKVARLSPMRVPPPMPCAISASLSTARVTSRSRSDGETCAGQEADKERRIEAHRAGGVEQDDQPQRLDLAPPPGQVDQRAAMRHVAMN